MESSSGSPFLRGLGGSGFIKMTNQSSSSHLLAFQLLQLANHQ